MRKKRFAIVLTACLLISGTFTMNGTAYADTIEPVNKQAAAQEHACGYSRAIGNGIPLEAAPQTVRTAPNRIARYSDISNTVNPYALGYNELAADPQQKRLLWAYGQIARGIEALDSEISVYRGEDTGYYITTQELDNIYNRVKDDHPEYFWLGTSYRYTYINDGKDIVVKILPDYLVDSVAEMQEEKRVFDVAVEAVYTEVSKQQTPYEKELWLHDYLIETNDYISYSKFAHTAYGALVEGECVCEGYTRAFQLLLNKLGIENYPISGSDDFSATMPNHIWNMVKLEDAWYQVDITWDDEGNDDDDVFYAYFNITGTTMQRDHKVIGNYVNLPACNGTTYNYYRQNPIICFDANNVNNETFVAELERQLKATGFARIYAENDTAAQQKLWQLYCTDEIVEKVAAAYADGSYSTLGCVPRGQLEYHFYMYKESPPQESEFYGNLVQWDTNLDNVTIRLYGSDAEIAKQLQKADATLTEDERLEFIQTAITKHRKDDDYHKAVAEKYVIDADADWYDEEDRGTCFTRFKCKALPIGEYNLAVYKEYQSGEWGLWTYRIQIGAYGTKVDANDNDNCWWNLYSLGDLDNNCYIDGSDALYMKRYLADWETYRANGNWYAADIDNDGEITIKDLTILQRHLADWPNFENLEDYESGVKTLPEAALAA